jgi:hypothetical protein
MFFFVERFAEDCCLMSKVLRNQSISRICLMVGMYNLCMKLHLKFPREFRPDLSDSGGPLNVRLLPASDSSRNSRSSADKK